ncbi:unnamed protein product [Ixodes persulcatus]
MSEECIPVELLTVEVEMPASPEPTSTTMDLGRGMPSKCAEADEDLALPMDEAGIVQCVYFTNEPQHEAPDTSHAFDAFEKHSAMEISVFTRLVLQNCCAS